MSSCSRIWPPSTSGDPMPAGSASTSSKESDSSGLSRLTGTQILHQIPTTRSCHHLSSWTLNRSRNTFDFRNGTHTNWGSNKVPEASSHGQPGHIISLNPNTERSNRVTILILKRLNSSSHLPDSIRLFFQIRLMISRKWNCFPSSTSQPANNSSTISNIGTDELILIKVATNNSWPWKTQIDSTFLQQLFISSLKSTS